jgi:hypothetical protein
MSKNNPVNHVRKNKFIFYQVLDEKGFFHQAY